MSTSLLVKLAGSLLTSQKGRNVLSWIIAAVLSPLLILVVLISSLAAGASSHNTHAVQASFYGTSYSEQVPAEYVVYIDDMQAAFSLLDSSIARVNANTSDGNGLDPIRVKAIFYALCFGDDAPSRRAANRFVDCFYQEETRTHTVTTITPDGPVTEERHYTIAVPVSIQTAYENLSSLLGRAISTEDKSNADHIYNLIAGGTFSGSDDSYLGSGTYDGSYLRRETSNIDLDISEFVDPTTKNANDLVTYVTHAWESGWGYVWGTYGGVLSNQQLQSKISQYPEGVGNYASFISQNWLGKRTTDCVGLIKGYGWLDPQSLSFKYGSHGMPDYGANQMYYSASVSGPIETMPDKPGLAVWHKGHIGVYIGDSYVIEAMGTKYGVVKTKLEGRGWTHWLQIESINYD